MPLSPLLRAYDHVLLDLDGCVWIGDEAAPGAVEAVTALRAAGKRVAYVTNDGRHAGEDFVRKLWALGFQASLEEVVTVGGALQHWLAERGDRAGTAFVIGSAAIWRHVEEAGLRIVNGTNLAARADVVVVAGHDDFDYAELRDATQAVLRGAGMVATGRDATFPMSDGPWPGTGAIVAALEKATGATALSLGKPEADLFHTALDRLGAPAPGPDGVATVRALVIGDRLDSDLAGAHAAGLDAAIVLSGATDRAAAEAAKDPAPVAIAETLGELVLGRA
ncbi:MAG: glycerol-phosphatase [Solirubrobacteraceae bacterium]|nr:glycerol-phosphatase [Solirubrobacteraceae bacterium]